MTDQDEFSAFAREFADDCFLSNRDVVIQKLSPVRVVFNDPVFDAHGQRFIAVPLDLVERLIDATAGMEGDKPFTLALLHSQLKSLLPPGGDEPVST
jgi:hypothetical protein